MYEQGSTSTTEPTDSTIPPLTKPEVVEIVKDNLPEAVAPVKQYNHHVSFKLEFDGNTFEARFSCSRAEKFSTQRQLGTWLYERGFTNNLEFMPLVGVNFQPRIRGGSDLYQPYGITGRENGDTDCVCNRFKIVDGVPTFDNPGDSAIFVRDVVKEI